MDRHPAFAAVGESKRLAAHLGNGHDLPDQRARRGCPERDGDGRADQVALMLDPPAAGADLAGVGLVVDLALAALDKLEVLDGVGDVDLSAVNPGLFERCIEDRAGGTDERPPGDILLVARLLADEHDRGVERAFAEHRLGRIFVKVAADAFARVLEQRLPRSPQIPAGLDLPLGLERFLQPFDCDIGHRPFQRATGDEVQLSAAACSRIPMPPIRLPRIILNTTNATRPKAALAIWISQKVVVGRLE